MRWNLLGGPDHDADVKPGDVLPRVGRLQDALRGAGLDGALLFGPDEVCHLTGYWRYLEGTGAVVLPAEGLPLLVIPRDEEMVVDPDAPVSEVVAYGAAGYAVELDPDRALARALHARTARGRWGVALGHLVPGVVSFLGPMPDFTEGVVTLRRLKDADEMARIAASVRLTLLGHLAVQSYLEEAHPTEIGALSRAHAVMQEAAGEVIEVVADMIAGDHASGAYAPVATPGPRPVGRGEAVISDLLVRHKGYWGQSTRTLVRGDMAPPDVDRAVAELHGVLQAGVETLRPGIRSEELNAVLQGELQTRLPGASCPHHMGHGIGITFADPPQIVDGEPAVLEQGMVLTLSPGAYLADAYGARVANIYQVTSQGGRLLAASLPEA